MVNFTGKVKMNELFANIVQGFKTIADSLVRILRDSECDRAQISGNNRFR